MWEHLAFNNEVVSDRRIREAMALSVNREQLINEVLQGQARALQSVLVPDQGEYYNPAWERYSQDLERARQLVQEAEADGVSTEIQYSTTSDNRLRETTQQIIQQQMEEIGITLNIQNSSAETFFGEQTPSGDFELGQWAWSADPDPSITTLFSANNLPPDGQNYYRYESEEATRLMEQSDLAIEEEERIRLIRQAQEVMAGDVPLIPLYQRPETYAFNEALSGPVVNPTIAGAFWNTETWTLGG